MSSLSQRGMRAAIWNSGGNLVRIGLQFGVGILLARLIGPEGFGLVAVALAVMGLGQLFVDFGFNAAIVQTKDLTEADIDGLGTLQIIIGAAMTVLVFVAAPAIASFFQQPAARPVVEAISLIFVIRAFGQNAVALLSRELRFRAVQIGLLAGYVVGYIGVGVPLALAGYGAWSIVAAQLCQVTVTTVAALYQAGRRTTFSLRGVRPELLTFGRRVMSANLGSWVLASIDAVVVGHVLGATTLALYNRANNLANAPAQGAVAGLQGVLFAATARAQDNPEGCRRAFYLCVEIFSIVFGAMLATAAVTSTTVLKALYGSAWLAAAPILTPLCLAAFLTGIVGFFGPVIMGLGGIQRETKAQWIAALIMAPMIYLAARVSAASVAWAVVTVNIIRLALLYGALDAVLTLSARRFLRSSFPGIIVAAVAAGSAATLDHMVVAGSALLQFLLVALASGVGVVIALAMAWPLLRGGAAVSMVLERGLIPPQVALRLGLSDTKGSS